MWEVQLRNLGGLNYMRFGPKPYDEDGREVLGSRGYKYFGPTRELPEVKELFDELKPSKKAAEGKDEWHRQRAEMRRNVNADYYGFNRDEDDGALLAYERMREVESFRNVERVGEEASEGWTPIPNGWIVPGFNEVTEFLVGRRKSRLSQKLGRGRGASGEGVVASSVFGGGREGNCLSLFFLLYD